MLGDKVDQTLQSLVSNVVIYLSALVEFIFLMQNDL